jgi:hypothetical protein
MRLGVAAAAAAAVATTGELTLASIKGANIAANGVRERTDTASDGSFEPIFVGVGVAENIGCGNGGCATGATILSITVTLSSTSTRCCGAAGGRGGEATGSS